MKKSLLVMAIILLMLGLMGGIVSATEDTVSGNTGSETVSNSEAVPNKASEQPTTNDTNSQKVDITKVVTGTEVKSDNPTQETVKPDPNDPTPFIKPMTGKRFNEWLMGLGLGFLASITNLSYVVFSIVIVLGAIVMVLPSLHSHPVMKWTGISMVVGGFMGFVIIMLYPMILGLIQGAVSTL
jgi:hypothetical protein